ncbi:hypothetical protein [Roseateles sp.]|uniref:hypothetical protein n=1 Tax=Roseateles sp. TaxID=1971397 RepID=UPI0039EB1A8A
MKFSRYVLPCVALIAALWAGVPAWLAMLAAIALAWLAAGWAHRQAAEPASPAPTYGAAAVASAPASASSGSGLMGVGLAAAGGVAAGLLAEKLLSEGRDAGGGGFVPGSLDADSSAADELARRDVEFGSGDGWGGRDTGLGVEDW